MTVENSNKRVITTLNGLCITFSKLLPKDAILSKTLTSLDSNTKADGASLYFRNDKALRFSPIKSLKEISLNSTGDKLSSISAHFAITKEHISAQDEEKSFNETDVQTCTEVAAVISTILSNGDYPKGRLCK